MQLTCSVCQMKWTEGCWMVWMKCPFVNCRGVLTATRATEIPCQSQSLQVKPSLTLLEAAGLLEARPARRKE